MLLGQCLGKYLGRSDDAASDVEEVVLEELDLAISTCQTDHHVYFHRMSGPSVNEAPITGLLVRLFQALHPSRPPTVVLDVSQFTISSFHGGPPDSTSESVSSNGVSRLVNSGRPERVICQSAHFMLACADLTFAIYRQIFRGITVPKGRLTPSPHGHVWRTEWAA